MKFKCHAQMKKHELMIAILKCKTCVKKLMRLQWISFKGFYNPNVSPSLLVEHGYYHTGISPGKIE